MIKNRLHTKPKYQPRRARWPTYGHAGGTEISILFTQQWRYFHLSKEQMHQALNSAEFEINSR